MPSQTFEYSSRLGRVMTPCSTITIASVVVTITLAAVRTDTGSRRNRDN